MSLLVDQTSVFPSRAMWLAPGVVASVVGPLPVVDGRQMAQLDPCGVTQVPPLVQFPPWQSGRQTLPIIGSQPKPLGQFPKDPQALVPMPHANRHVLEMGSQMRPVPQRALVHEPPNVPAPPLGRQMWQVLCVSTSHSKLAGQLLPPSGLLLHCWRQILIIESHTWPEGQPPPLHCPG